MGRCGFSTQLPFRREAAEGSLDFPPNADAQFRLGLLYYEGKGVPQNYAEAAAWLRKAADQGSADAQNTLGAAYQLGKGVPQDYVQAAAWHRRAAEQDDADAQCRLGVLYAEGRGVAQDNAQAAVWFRKAAEQGNVSAQLNLGVSYENGHGVPKDWSEAYFWVKLAAAGTLKGAEKEDLAAMLDIIATHLTTAAVFQAQERVTEWLRTHAANAQ